MKKNIFITGISTDVGKTLAAAIVVEALEADYWKPIQAGDVSYGDKDRVQALVSNSSSKFFPNTYALKTPMSPHAAAEIDQVTIQVDKITAPETNQTLVIEGAGGLLVPINNTQTIADIIPQDALVVVVSKHYLGSINHTLMTLELLKQKGVKTALIYSGDEHPTTESIVAKMTNVPVIGRINQEAEINKQVVKKYATLFKSNLEDELN